MNPRTLAALLIVVTSLLGCSRDRISTPEDPGDEPLASIALGPDGGELISDEVSLVVPPGALVQSTTLEIYADPVNHPMGQVGVPVYRLEGLPENLSIPVTLRVRYPDASPNAASSQAGSSSSRTAAETTSIFLGELRDSRSERVGLVWYEVESWEQDGWWEATLEHGPVELGDAKVGAIPPEGLKITIVNGLGHLSSSNGHYEVVWGSPQTADQAAYVAEYMEWSYDQVYALGFEFGDDATLWPRKIYIMEPDRGLGTYAYGRHGRGVFVFSPRLFGTPQALNQALIHEVFHHGQQWYDPRPSEQWNTVNHERTWIDEACASWIEEKTLDEGSFSPLSLVTENYPFPLLYGIAGPERQRQGVYGYAMSMFIKYVVDTQGESRVHEIFEAFAASGSGPQSVMSVLDPPLKDWCSDFHRLVVLDQIYPAGDSPEVWDGVVSVGHIVGGSNEALSVPLPVSDFGSLVCKFSVTNDPLDPASALGVLLESSADITLFGIKAGEDPVLLTHGPDSLAVGNLPSLLLTYDEFMLMVTRPVGTRPTYDDVEVVEAVIGLVDMEDFSRFDTGIISCRYHAFWDTGEVPWQSLSLTTQAGVMNGNSFTAVWDSTDTSGVRFTGQITIAIDPDSKDLASWSGESRWDYPSGDTYNLYQISGGPMPLTSESANQLAWQTDDAGVCDVVTSIYVKFVVDGSINRELQSYICDGDSYLTVRIRDEL